MLLMGQALGLEVVVEGVERQEQLDLLHDMRYDVRAQGYLLGRPMTLDHLLIVGVGAGLARVPEAPVLEHPARPAR